MKANRIVRGLYGDERGVSLVVFTIMAAVLFGFGAMVIDTGAAWWNRRLLQNAVDGAALAGAAYLPGDPVKAEQVAIEYALKNGIDQDAGDTVSVAVTNQYGPYGAKPVDVAVTVTATRPFNFGLRYILGGGDATVASTATAVVAPVQEPANLWPMAMFDTAIADCQDADGCVVKSHSPSSPGNFGFLDLDGDPGGGSEKISEWLVDTYVGPILDEVLTETGNMTSTKAAFDQLKAWDQAKQCDGGNSPCPFFGSPPPPYDSLNWNPWTADGSVCINHTQCPRVGIVPIVDADDWPNGNNKPVDVVSYACVYILNYTNPRGNQVEVTVRVTPDGLPCMVGSGSGTPGQTPGDTDFLRVFLWR